MAGMGQRFALQMVILLSLDTYDGSIILQIHEDRSKSNFLSAWNGHTPKGENTSNIRSKMSLVENLQHGSFINKQQFEGWYSNDGNAPDRILMAAYNKLGDVLWNVEFNTTGARFMIENWMTSSRLIRVTNGQSAAHVKHWSLHYDIAPTFGIIAKDDPSRGWFALIGENFEGTHFIFSKDNHSHPWRTDRMPLECLQSSSGYEYKGTMSYTTDGHVCQRWDSQFPHSHSQSSLGGESNYCRNTGNQDTPWCFTTDVDVEWDHCQIPECELSSKECISPDGYFGQVNLSRSGKPCMLWKEINTYPYLSNESNSCRVIDKGNVPKCYTSKQLVEPCDIASCGSPLYAGCISSTELANLEKIRWPLSKSRPVERCISSCEANGYHVAAVQIVSSRIICACLAHTMFTDNVKRCQRRCSHLSVHTCGGLNYFSVYKRYGDNYFPNYGHGTSKQLLRVRRSYSSHNVQIQIDRQDFQNASSFINGIRVTYSQTQEKYINFALAYNSDGKDNIYPESVTWESSQPKQFTLEKHHQLEILMISNLTLTFKDPLMHIHLLRERTVDITLFTNDGSYSLVFSPLLHLDFAAKIKILEITDNYKIYPFIIAPYMVVFSETDKNGQTTLPLNTENTPESTSTVQSSVPSTEIPSLDTSIDIDQEKSTDATKNNNDVSTQGLVEEQSSSVTSQTTTDNNNVSTQTTVQEQSSTIISQTTQSQTSKSTHTRDECQCKCAYVTRSIKWSNLTQRGLTDEELYTELEGEIKRIKKELALNKSSISNVMRKKTSAVDTRTSSLGIGCIGVAIILAVVLFLLVLDSKMIAEHLCKRKCYKEN